MTALGATLQLLRSRGFVRTAPPGPGIRAFEGPLCVSAGEVRVRIEIEEWDFLSYPRIEILDRPPFLPTPIPHIDATGGLCYLARDSVVLDRFAPAGAVALCLNEAQRVLESLVTDPDRRKKDVQDELLAYWSGGVLRTAALIGNIDAEATRADCSIIELPPERLEGARVLLISSSDLEVENIARSVAGKILSKQVGPCWIFSSVLSPVAPESRLPTTVVEALKYLKYWDESIYRAVHRTLGSDKEYLKYNKLRVVIRTPVGWLGFEFDLNPVMKKGFARKPEAYRQFLHAKGAGTAISRLTLMQVGADFLHARNLNVPTLAGKNVQLIGCGSVGSYLAQALARLGAGAHGGVLRIVDPQLVEAENVGRHWLGLSSLFLPKAQAVVAELEKQFPSSQFTYLVRDVREVRGLYNADLIVDATGIEPLSEVINALHCERNRAKAAPVLHVWVAGNGDAVQGLWVDSPEYGCYRCLRLPRGSRYRDERFPVLTREPEMRRVGCGDYRPYAVSAPMNAAALASEFVMDWLSGNPSPRFRTLAREGTETRKQKNRDFEPLTGCPACNP